MSNYRRAWVPGGTYFFTVNLLQRDKRLLVEHIEVLRAAFRQARTRRPFEVLAIVILPDHLHCLWRLPQGDADNAIRWRLIKTLFSQTFTAGEYRSVRRLKKHERGIWQRRYWEHLIRDEDDFAAHVDYIHYNPVKHGHVARAADWPHSSFHRYVQCGDLPEDWANAPESAVAIGERKPRIANNKPIKDS
jgi:putative transposase